MVISKLPTTGFEGCHSAMILGFGMPEDRFVELSAKSRIILTQTQSFARGLQRALQKVSRQVSLVSFAQVQNFPRYPSIIFRTSSFSLDGARGLSLGFLNIIGLKHLSRTMNLNWSGHRYVDRIEPDLVAVHGVHTPLMRFALALKRRHESLAILVLTDAPSQAQSRSPLKRLLYRINARSVRRLAKRFDAVLALTEDLARDWAPGVPYLVFHGWALEDNPTVGTQGDARSQSSHQEGRIIAYAGGLSDEYGVSDLVRAFEQIPDARMRLEVYGAGPLADWIQSRAAADPRIRFRGAIGRDALLLELRGVDLLVNPRRLDFHGIRWSFPSKLMEYVSLGVPTMTTPMPTLTPEFRQHVIVTDSDGVSALKDGIISFSQWPEDRCKSFGAASAEWLQETYSPSAVGERLQELIGRVIDPIDRT